MTKGSLFEKKLAARSYEKYKAMERERTKQRGESGLCTRCGRVQDREGYVMCKACAVRHARYRSSYVRQDVAPEPIVVPVQIPNKLSRQVFPSVHVPLRGLIAQQLCWCPRRTVAA